VHGVDAAGQVLIRRQLKRRYVLAFFRSWGHEAERTPGLVAPAQRGLTNSVELLANGSRSGTGGARRLSVPDLLLPGRDY
jgi:hypothetical protein